MVLKPVSVVRPDYASPEVWALDGVTALVSDLALAIRVYPNPASEVLVVENAISIHLCDASGRQVLVSTNSHLSRMELDISHLKAGLYLLKSDGQVHKVMVR